MPVAALFRRVAARARDLEPAAAPARLYLSSNSKTGCSVNLPVTSCEPTRGCADYCYALIGPIATPRALARQAGNEALLRGLDGASDAAVDAVAAGLVDDVRAARRSWFRWHGVGDLLPGSVRVVNAVARRAPDVVQWVVTRKPALAARLDDAPAVRLLLSADATTPAARLKAMLELRVGRRAPTHLAWVRREGETPPLPPWVDVVFNEHRGRRSTSFEDDDPRTCGATDGTAEHDGACDRCRRCFAPSGRAMGVA